ncbi:long-chain fatty acid--CoA ligase [Lottiidibacillus patelloidae]|uniref:Long-chain fatty acid--CoA ligase n=1 Tax=Lottiidibacillus patelloidae TaxID=2670334 RepID=A0A263BXD7_9BACI|nr:long-chain fatty acid--CoA ligase [Lottiidibacillus patelloidae]OZM58374.1 long-chain fatty acid--CoA ligase [Lottiidibacillus patelloidae]
MQKETDWLHHRSTLTPEKVAVIDGDNHKQWTYEELHERAENYAVYLQENGVAKGDRIALLSSNHICYFDLLFACSKIGAIFVPLNWRLAKEELSYILQDCTPTLLFYHSDFSEVVTFLNVNRTININKAILEGKKSYLKVNVIQSDPAAIIYTGGTTGKPKGVVLTHQNIHCNAVNTVVSWQLKDSDTTAVFLPMFHTGGLNALAIPILLIGGTVVLTKKFEPTTAIRMLNDYKCTIALLVPTMYHLIVKTSAFSHTSFPTMHTFLSGGAPCPLTIYREFEKKGLSFKEGYGLTEAGPNNFYISPKDALKKRGSVGKPMLYNEVKLIADDGKDVQSSEVGEIIIRGGHVFSHYWNNENATSATLVNGWLHTGDLARKDEEGYYYIVGRKKEMIITGGENVFPLEIEHILSQHDAVDEVAIIGLPDEKWGEVVTAIIVPSAEKVLSIEEVQKYCAEKLGKYKVPKKVVFTEKMPKTDVGKIDKKAIYHLYSY